jgi:hypothetical protein
VSSRVRWNILVASVRNAQGGAEAPTAARAAVEVFRRTGGRPRYGWLPCGLARELEHRIWTWGPSAPAEVDWSGF